MLERHALAGLLKRLWLPLRNIYSLLIIICGWVLFRATNLTQAAGYWRAMFGFGSGDGREYYPALYLDAKLLFFLGTGILASTPLAALAKSRCQTSSGAADAALRPWAETAFQILSTLLLLAMLLASSMVLAQASYNPFIYFRF
jgi:alginate O-acetyltransferase complex protein AlgI